MSKFFLIVTALTASLSAHISSAADDAAREKVRQFIIARDAEFWEAYNACDTSRYDRYFTPDVEFYHDRGGITLGLAALTETTRKNLCSGPKPHLRRDPVPETARLSLLENEHEIYGAILSGEHLFFVLATDKPPRLDGRAHYVHLWLKRDGEFKMARILSYDHGPAFETPTVAIIPLSAAQLDRCMGKFHAPKSGDISVTREDDHLALDVGGKRWLTYPTSETLFVLKDRPVSFEFHLGQNGPEKVTIRENGAMLEEALPRTEK